MENGIWNVFRNNRIEDEEQHRKGINLKKEEMTNMDFLLEAVGIVAAMIYLGLQIYYGIVYGVAFTGIILNAAILILVYVGLTLLARYPERVNNLPKEICSGKIRKYTIRKSVRDKLKRMKGEVKIMKMSKLRKLAVAGAIAAATLISFTTVNAATDGAVINKITETITNVRFIVDGREVEKTAVVKEKGEDYIIYEMK